jgi:hypothetical protein
LVDIKNSVVFSWKGNDSFTIQVTTNQQNELFRQGRSTQIGNIHHKLGNWSKKSDKIFGADKKEDMLADM